MKLSNHHLYAAGIATFLVVPVLAIEPPVDDAPPPPEVNSPAPPVAPKLRPRPDFKPDGQAESIPEPSPRQESAFLGLISSSIPEILATHLGLKPGEGVVVRAVVPDGPAAQAGIVEHDVILRIGGEPLGSPAELSQNVMARKPGDSVNFDIIHAGKPSTHPIQLGTRPAGNPDANPEMHRLGQLQLDGMPPEQADRIRDLIEKNLRRNDLFEPGSDGSDVANAIQEMQRRMSQAFGERFEESAIPNGSSHFSTDTTIRMKDDKGTVELKANNGAKEVTVRDESNNIAWSGPWDTEQDKAAAPAEIRERVDKLNLDASLKDGGFRFQFGGSKGPR
jgi:serine protease Do